MRGRWSLSFLALALSVLTIMHPAMAAVEIGKPAPPLVGKVADGTSFDLAAMKGKVVLVNFWASWCGPCREEMPELELFYRSHHPGGLEIIAISVDRERNRDEVAAMMKAFTFRYVMFDDVSSSGFGMPAAIPVTYVIDTKGVVRARLTPDDKPLSNEVLSNAVVPLLKR